MTCIVAIKKENTILLGADSAASGNNRIISRKDKKIFRRGNIVFGFAGSFRVGQLIRYQLKIPKKPNNVFANEYIVNNLISAIIELLKENKLVKNNQMDCELIIIFEGQVYKVDVDFQVEVTDDEYVSIGDGSDVAIGALFVMQDTNLSAEQKAEKALIASARYCTTVSAPFYYIEQ